MKKRKQVISLSVHLPGKKERSGQGRQELHSCKQHSAGQAASACLLPGSPPCCHPTSLVQAASRPALFASLSAAIPPPDTHPCQASSILPQSTRSSPQLPAQRNALLLPSSTLPSQIHHTASLALVGFLSGHVSQYILSAPFHPLLQTTLPLLQHRNPRALLSCFLSTCPQCSCGHFLVARAAFQESRKQLSTPTREDTKPETLSHCPKLQLPLKTS